MAMKPKHAHMWRMEPFTEVLGRAAQECIPLELREEMRELLLGDMESFFAGA